MGRSGVVAGVMLFGTVVLVASTRGKDVDIGAGSGSKALPRTNPVPKTATMPINHFANFDITVDNSTSPWKSQ